MKSNSVLLIFLIVYTSIICSIILFMGLFELNRTPKFTRADDGTPCITFKNTITCNFEQRNKETNFGEYPYSMEK